MTETPTKIYLDLSSKETFFPDEANFGSDGLDLYHHDAEVQRLIAEARAAAFEEAAKRYPLTWSFGSVTTTDDDNGPREGRPRELHAWRAGGFTIIKQDSKDGLFLLRGHSGGMGHAYPTLKMAMLAAEDDYRALSDAPPRQPKVMHEEAPSAIIGEIGNQIHNIACEMHGNDDLVNRLESLAIRTWTAAKLTSPEAPRQVTPQEAAKVLLEADDYMPTTAKLAATKAHLGRDSKVQPVAIAEAWRAALRALANGGDSDE